MNVCRISLPLLSLLFALTPRTASSQSPEPRLHGAIRGDAPAVLTGSLSPRVRHSQDLGPISAGHVLGGITLVFHPSPAQQADLDRLLIAQQDPASPEFHHWLSPEAFGQRFGMADADLDTTQRWLTAQGFTISGIARARDRITFSGTAAQVAAAFHTTLHHYQIDGERHMAPSSELSLPADLAAITTAVLHLSDFRPHPSVHPAFTSDADQAHYLTPEDLEVMYDIPTGTDADTTSGTGQSIAIIGQSYIDTSGSARFRSFSDAVTTLSLFDVLVPNSGVEAISPGDAAETEIDLEYAGGVAPRASIFLVHVGSDPTYNVFDALAFAVDQNLAPVINISYGECETLLSPTELAQGNALFAQAAMQGQTVVAAAGDAGSTACAPVPSGYVTLAQQQALAVDYPAASPYVTAVGGTQMAPGTFTGNTIYWTPTTYGFDLVRSLISYVPEVTWNEDSTSGIFAGGGGASSVYARPAWQVGIQGIPTGTTRLLPDLALQASSQNPGFLLCSDDVSFLASEGQRLGCQYQLRADNGRYTIGGGTSFAAPVVAAITALINQNQHELGQGVLAATLYRLARDPATSSSVFHDIASGSIACTSGSPTCSVTGQSGFAAGPGYDQATGLGSVDYAHLVAAWPATHATSLGGTITQVEPSGFTAVPGAFDALSISVSAYPFANGTLPTGTVSVALDGAVVDPAVSVTSIDPNAITATGSYLLRVSSLPGTHIATVTYSGDSTHAPSTATAAILAGNVVASGGLSLTAGNVSVPRNGSANTQVTVTPLGGYNGRLFWSVSLAGGNGSSAPLCYSIPTLPVTGVTSTTLTFAAGTSCSTSLPAVRSGGLHLIATGHIACHRPHPSPWNAPPVVAGFLLFSLLPAIIRRRRPLPLLGVLMLATVGTTLSGCGGGGGSSSSSPVLPPPATTAVTYTVTLTGQDSVTAAVASSTTFTLTVQ